MANDKTIKILSMDLQRHKITSVKTEVVHEKDSNFMDKVTTCSKGWCWEITTKKEEERRIFVYGWKEIKSR